MSVGVRSVSSQLVNQLGNSWRKLVWLSGCYKGLCKPSLPHGKLKAAGNNCKSEAGYYKWWKIVIFIILY